MKELSLEEKAKAYDKALEVARELQENSNGMILKKWLWKVFPELRESEDERIRNDKWIDWLKKQGGKNPAWSKSDDIMVRDILGWIPAKSRPEFNQRRVSWLKSLKQRIERK